jgi:hypothetical protein
MTKPEGGRSGPDQGQTVTGTVVAQLKRLRRRREVTAAALAQRCATLGATEITEHVIRNIEVGRRTVSVDQVAVLALALDVSPAHLLCPARPREGQTGPAPIQVTQTVTAQPEEYAQWIRGDAPLPEGDEQAFYAYALENTPNAKDRQAVTHRAFHDYLEGVNTELLDVGLVSRVRAGNAIRSDQSRRLAVTQCDVQ